MTDSSTSQDTGITEAQAADRLFARYQSSDHDEGETQGEEPDPEDEEDAEAQADADDPTEGDESNEQDDAEPEADPAKTYRVKIDGEEVEVTEDELLKGYSREKDYTRKTQALAEDRKAVLTEKQAAAAARAEYADKLGIVAKIIEQSQPRVDQSLRTTNPAEWSAQMLQHREWAEQRQAVEAQKVQAEEGTRREEAERLETLRVETIARLREEIPEWKDPAVMKAEDERLGDYAATIGLDEGRLRDLQTDADAIKVLRKAMLFDELMAKKPAVQDRIKAVKTLPPGPKAGPSRSDEKRARERLTSDGSTDAAVALILAKSRRA